MKGHNSRVKQLKKWKYKRAFNCFSFFLSA